MEMQYFIVSAILIGVALFIVYSRIYLLQVELKEQGEHIRVLTSSNHMLATGVRSILNSGSNAGGGVPEVKADMTSIDPAPKVAPVPPVVAEKKPIAAVLADEDDPDDEDLIDDISIRAILHQNSRGRFASISGVESDDDGDRAKVELIEEVKTTVVPEHVEGIKPLQVGTPADVEETNAAEPAAGVSADDDKPVASTRVAGAGVGTCSAMIIDGKKAGQLCKKKSLKNKVFCREHQDYKMPAADAKPVTHSVELNFSDGRRTDPILFDGGVEIQHPILTPDQFKNLASKSA